MKKLSARVLGAVASVAGLLALSAPASAASISDLTSQINFDGVGDAVIAVAAALMGIYVLWKAAGMVLRAVRGM